MDHVSRETMRQFMNKYLDQGTSLRILDVGAMDVQGGQYGTYRQVCSPNWDYVGLDLEPGPNVDIAVNHPYKWGLDSEFDVVIAGQLMEHVEYPWRTMECIKKAMKPGALHINIIPSAGPIHRFPLDTYRYNPDGVVALCKWVQLEVVEIQHRNDSIWANVVLVARKPA